VLHVFDTKGISDTLGFRVRTVGADHVFAGEDVRLETLATLEALAIKLASHLD
jgi:hypothetical protein